MPEKGQKYRSNKYFADAIRDLDMFEPGSKIPGRIVEVIIRTLKDLTIKYQIATIRGVGRFFLHTRPSRHYWVYAPNKRDKFMKKLPAMTRMNFEPCGSIMKALED